MTSEETVARGLLILKCINSQILAYVRQKSGTRISGGKRRSFCGFSVHR